MPCLIALVLILLVPSVAMAGDAALEEELAAVLGAFLQANPSAPGVVVQVVCPPRGLDWTGAAGSADHEAAGPLRPDHTFRIASNTKTYVAAAVLRLAEMGRLELDDPLGAHLAPQHRDLLAADGYDLQRMTLRQVLSHTSGLNEHPADPRYAEAIVADPHHRWTPDEQILRCVEWTDPVAAPGDTFSYSDTGYVLLGKIIEVQTGLNLGQGVRHLLDYQKLGLDATWWEIMETVPSAAGPRAHQYYGDLDSYGWNPSLDLFGGGGIVCDVDDLGSFLRQLMQGGVLESASLEAMKSGGSDDYRLGLIHDELAGHEAWGHTGFWNTFAFHVPSLDVTISGCVLDHFAEHGRALAEELAAVVAADN